MTSISPRTARSTVFLWQTLLGLTLLLSGSLACAQAIVSQSQLAAATRIAKNTWQFTYQVTVQNGPLALNAVRIVVADPSPSGVIQQNSLLLGNLPANATVSAGVTFQATGNQPGANGNYHDNFWSGYLGMLVFEVIPGPGPVAQATLSSAQGGVIAVTGTGNPLNGTQVVVPPGALGDPTDTITVGYSNTLPAALNADAVAVGIVPVSTTLTLTRTGATALQRVVTVTVPYSFNVLGTADYPAVLYWDTDLQQYQSVQVTEVDQVAGTVTFATKHFTSFVVIGLQGLVDMLRGSTSFPPGLQSVDSNFRPAQNGFEVENFGTQAADASGGNKGVCFGMTAYAAWFYAKRPTSMPLFSFYSTPSDPGNSHLAQEDALARELVAQTFADTVADNTGWFQGSFLQNDYANASQFILGLKSTSAPQLAGLLQGFLSGGHSVLVYGWDAASGNFSVYDPNAPSPQPQPQPIHFTLGSGFDTPWKSARLSFNTIFYDAVGSHYDPATLNALYTRVLSGPPSPTGQWRFNNFLIQFPTLPLKLGEYPAPSTFQVDPTVPTPFQITWNCFVCAQSGAQIPQSYLHLYQDGKPIAGPLAVFNGGTITVHTEPFTKSTSELLGFVSQDPSVPPGNPSDPFSQDDITHGYDSFFRAELVALANPTVTLLASQPTAPLGTAVTLTWNSNSAQSCTESGGGSGDGWGGGVGISGSTSVTESASGTYTYTMTCTGAPGTQPAVATVSVTVLNGGMVTVTLWEVLQDSQFVAYGCSLAAPLTGTIAAWNSITGNVYFNQTVPIPVLNNFTQNGQFETYGNKYTFKAPANSWFWLVGTPTNGVSTWQCGAAITFGNMFCTAPHVVNTANADQTEVLYWNEDSYIPYYSPASPP